MNFTRFAVAASAALALGFAASAAQSATHYDAVADFSSTSATGAWSYGFDDGSGFQAFNTNVTGFNGEACATGLSCWYETGLVTSLVPMIAKNTTGGTITYANTVVHPADVLNLHPGMTLDGTNQDVDAVLRFTADRTGSYAVKGFFQVLDTNPHGVSITVNGQPVSVSGFADIGALTVGAPSPFSGRLSLNAGDTIDFRVNRAGEIWNDSTGLSVGISVPEPATWALMIMGFGGAGAMLRRRRAAFAV